MNRAQPLSVEIQLADISPELAADAPVRNVWRHADGGAAKAGVFKITDLAPHDSVFVVFGDSAPPPSPLQH
jgi:hypothetical protein